MNKKIFLILLILLFIGGIMPISGIYGQSQFPDWSKRTDTRLVAQNKLIAKAGTSSEEPNLDNLEKFSDLRGFILVRYGLAEKFKNLNLKNKYDVLITCIFDSQTPWPPDDKMPSNFKLENRKDIMNTGMDPGLNIRKLHQEGITGKGVNVAIIDQALLLEHEEYKLDKKNYNAIECKGADPEMHGSAVTSLFVGKKCGVAPDASLHYWGCKTWGTESELLNRDIEALKQIIKYNKSQKSSKDKIKIVSISCGFEGDKWEEILKEAKDNNLIVIHSGSNYHEIGCPLGKDRNNPENYDLCYWVREKKGNLRAGYIYIPTDNRTFASWLGEKEYVFGASGSHSWASPYLAGVMTLGFQIDPDLKEDDIWKYLHETGTPFNRGCIINPKGFVERVKLELENKLKKTK